MASNDFTLYPYPEAWNQDQTYLPTSSYADPSYLSATTFDSYPTQQSYAPLPEPFDFVGQFDQSKHHLQAPSPAKSASNSFDYPNPPALSSVSDSGASVQSTISSAMGSPSAQPQTNEWSHQQHNAHMFPGIVQQSDSLFSTSSFDFESIPATDKGCVGESTNISSSQQIPATAFSNFNPSHLPNSAHRNHMHFPIGATTSPKSDRTVLSPLELAIHARSNNIHSFKSGDNAFRSPTTPASATSPVLERVKGRRRTSTTPPSSRNNRTASRLTLATVYDESDIPPCPEAPSPILSSPFFSESNGSFILPLESSCPSL